MTQILMLVAAFGAAQLQATRIDADQLLEDVRVLAADSMEGRRTGTPGNEKARAYIEEAFRERGVQPFEGSYLHRFTVSGSGGESLEGVNVVGYVPGTEHPDRFIVLTAHYDHLGVRGSEIFNGADDNSSGTAAIIAVADYFVRNPPRNSIIVAALDAEEIGLQGARALVESPPVPLTQVVMNVNLDMVSRNERDELYAAGTHHYPFLLAYVEDIAEDAPVTLRTGHDSPNLPQGDDWTLLSDHAAFHEQGIPFIYFGVEDHEDYHQPTDVYANIDQDFFVRATETILDVVLELDRDADGIAAERTQR